ncbi:ejaculatory bulb-specific protein 3-like [Schistocerca gregaria]|uniref:ejaculatory bulb-specific protein 3-like n=1 Tax=Schistocerca gregaria TaxID=7010 RepID=UPI00211E74DA|nr:ejaculatory bulb-specific protein 3-like [Schistocerca gregaria]
MWACRALLPLAAFATVAVAVAVAAVAAGHQDPSLTAFINADWSAYLSDRAVVERHIKCVLDKMPCDADGLKLKRLVPIMVVQKCSQCTLRQRQNAQIVKQFLRTFYPGVWQSVEDKYRG